MDLTQTKMLIQSLVHRLMAIDVINLPVTGEQKKYRLLLFHNYQGLPARGIRRAVGQV